MADYELKDAKEKGETKDEALLALAKAQFERVVTAEQENRTYMLDDFRFRAASPDNFYQWPDAIRSKRETDPSGQRPCLTINKLPQHVNQVTNDIRQNRPAIKVIPVDDKADPEVAEVLNGVIRHIQYASDADIAYDTAADNQVVAGVGYIRVLTDYVDDESFDQDIKIERIRNIFTVYDDPDIIDPTGSDRKFLFITEMLSHKEFEAQYPDAEVVDWDVIGLGDPGARWYEKDRVRVAEWWRCEYEMKTLKLWASGATTIGDEDPVAAGVAAEGEEPIKTREVNAKKVMFRKICGHQILEESEWPGKYIPVARVVGNEYDIEGKITLSGLVRNAKDAQRMYNYWASQEVEMLALAPKAPFIAAAGQIEGYEHQWKNANTVNYAVLEYNPVVDTEAGEQAFPPPQRAVPPQPSQGILQAKLGASDDIKTTTGQYDASLGQKSNETSGKAILARQREGDIGTFQYVDNLSRAIRFVGRIIVDLIPKIYDTKRVARILGEDDGVDMATLDPNLPQAVQSVQDPQTGKELEKIYNPGVGRYDVAVVVGPSYTTKRQEALDAMTQMVQGNPQLWQVIGDLLVKNQDWPGADDMAKRLKAMLPPQLQDKEGDEDMPPQARQMIEQALSQSEQFQAALKQMAAEMQTLKEDREYKQQELMIKHYSAETDRMKVMQPAMNPQELAALAAQIVLTSLHSPSQPEEQVEQLPAVAPPPMEQMQQQPMQPPQGGFLSPEGMQ